MDFPCTALTYRDRREAAPLLDQAILPLCSHTVSADDACCISTYRRNLADHKVDATPSAAEDLLKVLLDLLDSRRDAVRCHGYAVRGEKAGHSGSILGVISLHEAGGQLLQLLPHPRVYLLGERWSTEPENSKRCNHPS